LFADDFASPSDSTWISGAGQPIAGSEWRAYTRGDHGVRIHTGTLQVTSSHDQHGQGYGYVRPSLAYSAAYSSALKANAPSAVVWAFNLQRSNPEKSVPGGFSCTSSSAQNDRTVGAAYVLATNSASGLNALADTCLPTATSRGYAVVLADGKLQLVRFSDGLRNGTLVVIAESAAFVPSDHLSARVTYVPQGDLWTLEARTDGASAFSDPSAGSFTSKRSAVDAVLVNDSLDFTGPYFQSGCIGLCPGIYTAQFDNVTVGLCNP